MVWEKVCRREGVRAKRRAKWEKEKGGGGGVHGESKSAHMV